VRSWRASHVLAVLLLRAGWGADRSGEDRRRDESGASPRWVSNGKCAPWQAGPVVALTYRALSLQMSVVSGTHLLVFPRERRHSQQTGFPSYLCLSWLAPYFLRLGILPHLQNYRLPENLQRSHFELVARYTNRRLLSEPTYTLLPSPICRPTGESLCKTRKSISYATVIPRGQNNSRSSRCRRVLTVRSSARSRDCKNSASGSSAMLRGRASSTALLWAKGR
jgi:hypothetical protein